MRNGLNNMEKAGCDEGRNEFIVCEHATEDRIFSARTCRICCIHSGALLLKTKEYFREYGQPVAEVCRGTEIVRTFKETLDNHYRSLLKGTEEKIFRVKDYASALNLHPNYLSNVVKSRTGKPISAWIADKTIAEAKSLLQNSTISIKEIAYQLGFAESTHFSNYFKKHTNFSPVSYRKQVGKS